MVVPVDPHEALIEEIRKEEFGINVQLSEDGQKLMTKQKERLGRSLDRLSKVVRSAFSYDNILPSKKMIFRIL